MRWSDEAEDFGSSRGNECRFVACRVCVIHEWSLHNDGGFFDDNDDGSDNDDFDHDDDHFGGPHDHEWSRTEPCCHRRSAPEPPRRRGRIPSAPGIGLHRSHRWPDVLRVRPRDQHLLRGRWTRGQFELGTGSGGRPGRRCLQPLHQGGRSQRLEGLQRRSWRGPRFDVSDHHSRQRAGCLELEAE